MLSHQIQFSLAVEEVYKPISGQVSDEHSGIPEGNPEGIRACEQYREIVSEMQATLKPELEMIETRVIGPADELLKVINSIRKMATKRDRKQLDLDRHTNSLTKLRGKKEPSARDEKALYTLENNVEVATQEYDYYNNMLKEELPALFQLEADFIRPLFQSFYYMQLNIFYTLYSRMEEMKIPYFDLTSDVMVSFETKRGNVQEETEAIGITQFRIGHAKSKLEMTKSRHSKEHEAVGASAGVTEPAAPPAYQAGPEQAAHQPSYGQPTYGQPAGGYGDTKRAPPPAPPARAAYSGPAVEYCTALYDYTPQAAGDLPIKAGDVIEIVQRTADTNGWWTGKVNGQQGVFPGNYVQLR